MLQDFILPAVSFGISATALPGPLIAYLVNTTLTQGWRKAMYVVLAPLITDAPIIILMTFILDRMPGAILQLIQVGGGCLLLAIAWGALKQYQSDTVLDLAIKQSPQQSQTSRRVLLTGIMMNFLSPGPWLFWASVNGPLLVKALEQSTVHAVMFMLAFYCTMLGGLCLWVLLFHQVGHVRDQYLRYIILATAILLFWFGAGLITAAIGLTVYQPVIVLAVVGAVFARRQFMTR